MKNTKKVYLLIDQWLEPLWYDEMFFTFDTKEKAIAKMNERRDEFLGHENEDYIVEREYDHRKRKYDDDLWYNMYIKETELL